MLECVVCCHAEWIDVSKIQSSARFITCAPRGAAKGRVNRSPAVFFCVKQRPVVRTGTDRICVKSALPSGWDAADPAESDEQKCLNATVSTQVSCTVLRNIRDQCIGTHVGIVHMACNIIVDSSCNCKRISLLTL